MLTTDEKNEVLELIKEVIANTSISRHEVVEDDDGGDCVYTIRKSDLLKSTDAIRKSILGIL